MADIEVWIDLEGEVRRVGVLYRQPRRGGEAVAFEYHPDWLKNPDRFSIEPALVLGGGAFTPPNGVTLFGSIGDSAPDTWGRRLMQRAERRAAASEGRAVRTLSEADYLLGVTDVSRLGALRFRKVRGEVFEAQVDRGVPGLVDLGRLLGVADRLLKDEESAEDLQLIFAPGSSLGGARPKASVLNQHGQLAIAKFPKPDDDYSIERWEAVALTLAKSAGIQVAEHSLIQVDGRDILLSQRFDRAGGIRRPFLSAMSILGLRDGQGASYPDLVDTLIQFGAQARQDALELYRRMVFNVLISNVDDHLRNHGFLWAGQAGWTLSPAFDLNPTPLDLKARILSTTIIPDDGTCDIELVRSAAGYFNLNDGTARAVISEVAQVTRTWRDVAGRLGARASEISRMESAFEHDDLARALRI